MNVYTCVVPAGFPESRADRALSRALPGLPGWALRDAFKRRDVKLNGRRIARDTLVSAGDVLQVYTPETADTPPGSSLGLEIVFEDEAYLVINKRQGMPAQGEGSVEAFCARHAGKPVFACHRLDVMTGGLLLLAKDTESLAVAEDAFARHRLTKQYRALVRGCPDPREATLTAYIIKDAEGARVRVFDRPAPGSLPVETRYRVVDADEQISRIEISLITGRTHQIRAHMAHIGHPILGDDKYGDRAFNRAHGAKRQMLWATRLVLWDGRTFEVREGF